jgi:Trp operon repressor
MQKANRVALAEYDMNLRMMVQAAASNEIHPTLNLIFEYVGEIEDVALRVQISRACG